MNHETKHKFIPVGGSITGRKHASETTDGYYYLLKTGHIYPATYTDKKRRKDYALQEYSILTGYILGTLHLVYDKTLDTLTRSNDYYYIKYGKIVLGRVIISCWEYFGKLRLSYEWFSRMDLRRYKSATHMRHNYHQYGKTTSTVYNNLKNRNRRLNKYRRY